MGQLNHTDAKALLFIALFILLMIAVDFADAALYLELGR